MAQLKKFCKIPAKSRRYGATVGRARTGRICSQAGVRLSGQDLRSEPDHFRSQSVAMRYLSRHCPMSARRPDCSRNLQIPRRLPLLIETHTYTALQPFSPEPEVLVVVIQIVLKQISEKMSAELACTYAALILNDDDVEITGDKISTILKV